MEKFINPWCLFSVLEFTLIPKLWLFPPTLDHTETYCPGSGERVIGSPGSKSEGLSAKETHPGFARGFPLTLHTHPLI